jgi:hypothetical protein
MAVVVNVDPNEVHAAASRWQMIGAEMGARGAPSVGISTAWPSAAATAGIHGQAAAAAEAFQTRIGDTAATSQVAANAFQTQDTKVGVDAFKDVLSAVSSMIGMFSGSMGSVNAATSMLGQLTSTMFNLDDTDRFVKVLELQVSWAHTYAEMEPGRTDRDRRENWRNAATGKMRPLEQEPLWWAFRISVEKVGRALDVDNVAKTTIDAFCARQIARDGSSHTQLGLYPDDTFDYVRFLQVAGGRGAADCTTIEIFACVGEL